MSEPSVSVVMATHNGLRFLPTQIASVLGQLRGSDELIVIDDASSDGTWQWLSDRPQPRVRLHRNARNLGVIGAFERALALARNPIVFLCDQDDVWLEGKRDAVVQTFERHANAMVVVSDAQVIDATGRIALDSFMHTRGGFRGSLASTLWRNRYLGCAMAVRREVAIAAAPIPRFVPMHDMWLGVVGRVLGGVRYLPQPLLQYRRHEGNVSPASRREWPRILAWRLQLLAALCQRLPRLLRQRRALRRGHSRVEASP
jgi:glycosyltransferase involved in cell wall biosynthesis